MRLHSHLAIAQGTTRVSTNSPRSQPWLTRELSFHPWSQIPSAAPQSPRAEQ